MPPDQQCTAAGDRRWRATGSCPAAYRSLLGYFPAALLQMPLRCGKSRALDLAGLAFAYGDATAITLGDVVLFKDERTRRHRPEVWAHELTHVMQYQRWGIEGFADRYVRCNSTAVEQEAIDNANRFAAWLPRRGLSRPGRNNGTHFSLSACSKPGHIALATRRSEPCGRSDDHLSVAHCYNPLDQFCSALTR